ncbi:ras association domain-containing protein [Heterostelium album PN500]|uniref:Ras association domain-containing protein n=1 Tax=Heterostelium pallidum (strain ATCC 26659 / Pp 5 / PN500) TaxID=670386 RepID=D3BQG4_HETP5|nr:ras association domain-containing protein [Heterostelium album PN500]EFA76384.1 ras association domain-containing protein [Heterostelium album PN500]|eukprot:XP_020428516.1 ras association domain-containing protein [Heterostelium album PN500]
MGPTTLSITTINIINNIIFVIITNSNIYSINQYSNASINDVVFKVYFADGSYKSMLVNENDATSKVVQTILEKVTFPKTKGLALFVATRDTSGISLS